MHQFFNDESNGLIYNVSFADSLKIKLTRSMSNRDNINI